jgi:hypothetical protein
MDSIRKKKKQNCSPNRFKRQQGTLLRKPWRTRRASSTRTKLIFPKSQKRKKRTTKQDIGKKKKKAYHDDEMLQIRKINKRIRFDSDPRPMQQKKLAIWKQTQGKEAERRRKEVNAQQQRPAHGGRRR